MDPWLLFRLLLLFILLLMSAFFSAAEVAFFSLSRLQVESLREHGGKAGRVVAALLERPRRLLVTIYTGNELVNVAIAAVSTIVALHFFRQSGVAVAVGASTLVLPRTRLVIQVIAACNGKMRRAKNCNGPAAISA